MSDAIDRYIERRDAANAARPNPLAPPDVNALGEPMKPNANYQRTRNEVRRELIEKLNRRSA